MAKILLIHGYAAGIAPYSNSAQATFKAFDKMIEAKDAVVFYWALKKTLNIFQFMNPAEQLNVYKLEKEKAQSGALQEELKNTLDVHKPEVIISHSMGAFLLVEFINKHGLPSHVKKIVFVQADISHRFEITDYKTNERLQKGELKWINYYFPLDSALWSSSILNRYIPAGLKKCMNRHIESKRFISFKKLNPHLSTICDSAFVDEITQVE
jgi:hypothetical protein